MDLNNPVIQLCIEGTRAEFEGRIEDARILYSQAWEASRDDFDACVAAHYVARYQEEPEETLRWNQEALNQAKAVKDGRVQDFYPSLYLNLGHSYEMLGHQAEAQKYYKLAAELGVIHQGGQLIRDGDQMNPYAEAESEPKSLHPYLLASEPQDPDLKTLESIRVDSERFALQGEGFLPACTRWDW